MRTRLTTALLAALLLAVNATAGPTLLIRDDGPGGLRGLNDLKAAVAGDGLAAEMWIKINQAADADLDAPVLTPASVLPDRNPSHVDRRNPNAGLINKIGRRVERAALAFLVTDDRRYLDSAWRQIAVLFDDAHWPDWRDLAHRDEGNGGVDLRTGDLAAPLGLCYDWLRPHLSDARRAEFLAGVDARVIEPFLRSAEEGVWWLEHGSNWTTRIVGGVGILGLGLGDDHPRAGELVAVADRVMFAYADGLGGDGSFNESPGYANSLGAPARYYLVRHYADPDGPGLDALRRLRGTTRWAASILLPGETGRRLPAFGDTETDKTLGGGFAGAVALATGDGVAQWLFLAGTRDALDRLPAGRIDPEALLGFDARVEPTPPGETLPPAVAYRDQGGLMVSRTNWNLSAESDAVVVYAKSGREAMHDQDDAGQLCVDVGTTRLIRDVGNDFTYPADYFGVNRRRYYAAAARGHNVLTFGDAVDGGMTPDGRGELTAFAAGEDVVSFAFDLSAAYADGRRVTRRVLHVLPNVVAVLDEATLPKVEPVTLRWHTADSPGLQEDSFTFAADGITVTGHVLALDGPPPTLAADRHAWTPGFETGRDDRPLPEHAEPFVALTAEADRVRWLTLFTIQRPGDPDPAVERPGDGFRVVTPDGPLTIRAVGGEIVRD